ncbi:MAG: Do family serine endopeptidase [Candidatus Riflebacteria bacterium]|nr:Do family serine endopeptidase [Candidatus Riflebacteria bacterium]
MKNKKIFAITAIVTALCIFTSFPASSAPLPGSFRSAFVELAKSLQPSVVNITVEGKEPSRLVLEENRDMYGGDDFNELLRRFFNVPEHRMKPRKIVGGGSGVIFKSDGTIITNNHVVQHADKITVKLSNGEEYEAEILGQDPQVDIAVIKIEPKKPLKPAKFADSDKVEPGEWAIAIGSPLGLEQTVTVGVVSATGRSGFGMATIEDYIQTDANINPGNSGGPLVNIDGEVMGINTMIFTAPGSSINFAIPSNLVSNIAVQLAESGEVSRPFLGISMSPVTEDLAKHYNITRKGAVVMEVYSDSPADEAGLKPMDIIVSVAGTQVETTSDVQKAIFTKKVGETIDMEIMRNGKKRNLKVNLKQMPESFGLSEKTVRPSRRRRKEAEKEPAIWEKLGFSVEEITKENSRKYGLKEQKGVFISSVVQGKPGAISGLRPGDILLQVNDKEIKDVETLRKTLQEADRGKKSSVFLIQRSSSPLFLVLNHESK